MEGIIFRKRCCPVGNQAGASIVEVMTAILVFMVIMVGGLHYYFLPQATIGRQKTKRLVVSAARDRMEKLVALQYAGVTPDSNETDTAVTVGNITVNRTTTITEVDDAADGLGGADADGDTVDYKSITVAMSWNDGSAKSLSFSTTVSIDDSSWVGGGSSGASNILFTTTRDGGNYEIYVMDADGSNQTRLTNNALQDQDPEWSRDGTKIVFASNRDDPNFEIYVMDADGSNPTRITSNSFVDLEPTWSPDGTKIAFTTTRDGGSFEVYMMDADGSNPTRLTTDAFDDAHERWSPDGSKIVFTSGRDGNFEIYVMDAIDGDLDGNGDNLTRLTTDSGRDEKPYWSPDGSKIIFGSEQLDPGNVDIYVMDADGAYKTRLISDAGFDTRPSWSADGSKIAFDTYRDGNWEVYVMDADGSNQTRLTNEAAALDFQPVLVPGASVSALPGWSRKCELVIQASQVPDTLTNFPVLLTEATLPTEMFDADGANPALNGGGDIKFSSDEAGATRLSCEIVTFTTDNNPANGKAEIWVKVPTVSGSSNTSIWVWYDLSGASQPQPGSAYGSESVWDSNYKGVWHLNETVVDEQTTGTHYDATSNNNDGSQSGNDDITTGQISNGQNFDGASDYIDIAAATGEIDGTKGSLSIWLRRTFSDGTDYYYFGYKTVIGNKIYLYHKGNDTKWYYEYKAGGTTDKQGFVNSTIPQNNWTYAVFTWSSAADILEFFVDAVSKGTSSTLGTWSGSVGAAKIGSKDDGTRSFLGDLDEARISNIVRSDDWITAEFNNQDNPATFVIEGTPATP